MKKIGLLTLALHSNYGGILQIFALQHHLNAAGYSTVLLERHSKGPLKERLVLFSAKVIPFFLIKAISPSQDDRRNSKIFRSLSRFMARVRHRKLRMSQNEFIDKNFKSRSGRRYNSEQMRRAIRDFELDAVIVGSDQVWRPSYQPHDSIFDYFLGFVDQPEKRRISYAASFGASEWKYPSDTEKISELLARFDAVSVREKSGMEICKNSFGRHDAQLVLDPTMLVDTSLYETIMSSSTCHRLGTNLLAYVLDFDESYPGLHENVADLLGDDCAVRSLVLDNTRAPIGIPEWLRAFKDATFVVTDSFHGTVFAILFEKNFVALVNNKRGSDRFTSLLSQLGLEDRLVQTGDAQIIAKKMLEPIDYHAVHRKIEAAREKSSQFLEDALQ